MLLLDNYFNGLLFNIPGSNGSYRLPKCSNSHLTRMYIHTICKLSKTFGLTLRFDTENFGDTDVGDIVMLVTL